MSAEVPIRSGALATEHQALLAAEAETWTTAEAHLDGAPGRDDAVARWSAARGALDAFYVHLARTPAADPAILQLKAGVLLAMHQGRLDDLDFAIEAAIEDAAAEEHACDVAMALSIARDVLWA